MTQTINYDKNPSAEGAAARVSRVGATPSLSTDAVTGWPVDGTKSHKLVATATTIATTGLPNADRPAAASGQKWSVSARLHATQARTVQLSIVFYNTVGGTLGTALLTTSTSLAFTAGQIATLQVNGATAPASTASVDVQVSRAAGGGAAISDAVYADMVSLTRTDVAVPYRPPADDVTAVWSGTVDASTQVYYDAVVTITPYLDAAPKPRVEVLVTDLSPQVSKITVWRLADDREHTVRGAVKVSVVGASTRIDLEIPPSVVCTYRAELFDSTDVSRTFTASTDVVVDYGTWIMNPLDPEGALEVNLVEPSGAQTTEETSGDVVYPIGRNVGVLVSAGMRGQVGYPLIVETLTIEDRTKVVRMLGSYARDVLPVLCVMTPEPIDIPRPFFVAVLSRRRTNINPLTGSTITDHNLGGDEVAPPTPALFVPLLTRADINASYATRAALNAANLTRLQLNRRYELAGTA